MVGLAGALAAGVALMGCAGRSIEGGVYRSPKGYRVTLPGPDWTLVESSRADLELRHRDGRAGMLANAACGEAITRRSPDALTTQLLAGLRARTMLERGQVSLNGHPAAHALVEARAAAGRPALRIETYTVTGPRCVYDLIYAAPAEAFAAGRPDFERLLATFATE